MSTRATILVKSEKFNESVSIYHHCDGYPEGVGETLKSVLSSLNWHFNYDVFDIANKILKLKSDTSFELTSGQHGDEEYAYLINVDEQVMKCYAVGWDEFEWKEEKLVFTESYKKERS